MKSKLAKPQPPLGDQEFADQVIAASEDRSGALLSILEKVQEHHPHKFLPLEILEYIADKTDIPLAQIYSVVTFYALFNLEPQGEHTICICRGTACHTRGSRNLLERLMWNWASRTVTMRLAPTSSASPRPTANTPCARWPASANAPWLRWWKWITPSTAT